MAGYEARAERRIAAPIKAVWQALTSDSGHSAVMFGAEVVTDWRQGSPIEWRGTWEGKPFTDRGEILAFEPPSSLVVTHYSPLSGEDEAAATHRVSWLLEEEGAETTVLLTQDGNGTEEAAEHASRNWATSLEQLERVVTAG
jgi:uncharacterized protein YndB with AHSA1/START domain